jgi:hypothetical protein
LINHPSSPVKDETVPEAQKPKLTDADMHLLTGTFPWTNNPPTVFDEDIKRI